MGWLSNAQKRLAEPIKTKQIGLFAMNETKPSTRDTTRFPQTSHAGAANVAAPVAWNDPSQRLPLISLIALTVLLVLAYFDMFSLTSASWEDPLYSHGYIVPLFALGLLWMRWQPFQSVPAQERWLGLAILVGALAIRLYAVRANMNPLDRYSFLAALSGLFLMVGGLHTLRWAGPAIGFLFFMYPLPSILEQGVLWRLQTVASAASTFILQTMGVPAFRQGNLITISGMDLFVADACSGLRMVTIFSALAVAMIFLIERPWWDKFMIILSAIPIALIVNIIRITVTGLLYLAVGPENDYVKHLGHDWAGYFMMPLALGFLWVELQVLERLTIPVGKAQLKPVGMRTAAVPIR
ncbi:MAG TPA: exosortase/archaeosortase family protein [Pirellulales bacterium]